MRFLIVFSLLALPSSALAKNFKCLGEKSEFETVEGIFLGEQIEALVLATSNIYNIYSAEGEDSIRLEKRRKPLRRGEMTEYPVQYHLRQEDDLGKTDTTFGVPLGTFGGSAGYKFPAVLHIKGFSKPILHLLRCELADD